MKKIFALAFALLLAAAGAVTAEEELYGSAPRTEYDGNGVPLYELAYELALKDGTARLKGTRTLSEGCREVTEASGTYEKEGNAVYIFTGSHDGASYYYTAYLEDGAVADAVSSCFAEAAGLQPGTYAGSDEELGTLSLRVRPDMTAVMTCGNGAVCEGTFSDWFGAWDFLFFDPEGDTGGDWKMSFTENAFTHEDFNLSLNAGFAGAYPMTGDLGGIILNVDPFGFASAHVPLNGARVRMTGSISVNLTDNVIDGFTLTTEDGLYTLEAQMTKLQDGLWNYYGYLCIALAAG